MIEDHFFLKNNVVDVDAAVVGVSMTRWITVSEQEASSEKAQAIMAECRFDVLPITTNNGIVKEYFHTRNWSDYNSIQRQEIDYSDVVSFRTPLHSLIKSFAKEQRLFYFLKNEGKIVGLASVANLNCRQVRIFIFSLISELEIRLSHFINSVMNEADLLDLGVREDIKERYSSDKKKGLEPNLMEYLYLSDLINLIAKKHLYKELAYESRTKFEDSFGSINALRNEAAHPTRSLITSPESVSKLWNKIEIVERCLFRLRQSGG